jgi:hypothetical protein
LPIEPNPTCRNLMLDLLDHSPGPPGLRHLVDRRVNETD